MLYRECRFQTAHEIFKKVVPDIPAYKVFQILGGMQMELFQLKVGNTQFYMICGSCTALSFEVFFNLFAIQYKQLDAAQLLENFSSDSYLYVIPISRSIIKKGTSELNELEASMMGHSYALIKEIDVLNKRIILNDLNPLSRYEIQGDETEWISTEVFETISKTVNSSFYDLKVHLIDIKTLESNKTIQKLCNMDYANLLVLNLNNILEDEISPIDHQSLKGQQVYNILCEHLLKLVDILKTSPNENVRKYIRIQIMYLRFSIASGSDSFYREEFADSLIHYFEGSNNYEVEQLLNKWKNISSEWRKIGRQLGKLQIMFKDEEFENLVSSFLIIKEHEPILIERTKKLILEISQEKDKMQIN